MTNQVAVHTGGELATGGHGAVALADVHPPGGEGKEQLPFLKVQNPVGQPQMLAQPGICTCAEWAVFETHDVKGARIKHK